MQEILIEVNDEEIKSHVEPRTHLADYLRENLRLTGTHIACEHGICGACTVLIDGQPARSCLTLAVACDGRSIRTIEGFRDDEVMDRLRKNFNKEHALQCGFCTPGMLITARDVVLRSKQNNEDQVRIEMSGNLCRCTGYKGIIKAILNVISEMPLIDSESTSIKSNDVINKNKKLYTNDNIPTEKFEKNNNIKIKELINEKLTLEIREEFIVKQDMLKVWIVFNNIPEIIDCIPGALISEYRSNYIEGKIFTKLGPIRTEFNGSASVKLSEENKTGIINGNGTDSLSGTRAQGEIFFQLYNQGNSITRVVLTINYNLRGPLNQFSRSGLISEFIKSIVAEFSENLNRKLAGQYVSHNETKSSKTIFVGKLLWKLIINCFKEKISTKNREDK